MGPMDAYATALVPALLADEGDAAGWRYVEFFTANIRNPNTRRAYAQASGRFFALVRRPRSILEIIPTPASATTTA
jgi:hypothetical protein